MTLAALQAGTERSSATPKAKCRANLDTSDSAARSLQSLLLIANPAMLHAVVAQDYAARWPDEVPPKCEAFCASVIPDETLTPI
jgi:hypothetical protein